MTSFQQFSKDLDDMVATKSKEEYLADRIDKAVKEVFRDAGLNCKQLKLSRDSFSCIVSTFSIDFTTLSKIQEYFIDYEMSINFFNTNFEFVFTKK